MRRLALVLSGGVSLGTFQAGVVDELLFLLGEVDRRAGELGREDLRVVPDVVTGASAGAMTGALAARAILQHDERRANLHRAWVEEASLPRFLARPPRNALLDPEALRDMADRFLGVRPGEPVAPPPFAPDALHAAFTLANLTGEDWVLPVRHPGADDVLATFFSHVRRFRLPREEADGAEGRRPRGGLESARRRWRELAETALASGHFPLAFPPVRLDGEGDPRAASAAPEDGYTFVDGGLFNNAPLRPAIELARRLDGGEVDPERVFLLVDPHLSRSARDAELGPDTPLNAQATRIVEAIRGESSALDWLRTLRTNRELEWRDRAVELVAGMLPEEGDPRLAEQVARLREVAGEVVEEKRRIHGEAAYGPGYLEEALERTRLRHLPRLGARLGDAGGAVDGDRAEAATLAIFLLNAVGGLDRKTSIQADVIHARPEETAGDRLRGFAGFFCRDWRESDYRLGRRKARARLPRILGVEDLGPFPAEAHPHRELYEPFLDPETVTVEAAPPGMRREVRDLLAERAVELLAGVGLADGRIRRFLARRAARRKIGRLLKV